MKNPMSPEFADRLTSFMTALQGRMIKHYVASGMPLQMPIMTIDEGQKYVRIWSKRRASQYKDGERTFTGGLEEGGSAYAFIDKTNGNIYKPAGWKAPEKNHPRGNIFDPDFGMKATGPHGVVYITGTQYPWHY